MNKECSQCDRPALARGLCQSCYGRGYRTGSLPVRAVWKGPVHRLSQVDIDTRTGTCSECGEGASVRAKRLNGVFKSWSCHGARKREQSPHARIRSNGRRVAAGITYAERLAMIEEVGECQICTAPLDSSTGRIDHCHDTGTVRGVLCHGCNIGLGFFRDSTKALSAAITYLTGTKGL